MPPRLPASAPRSGCTRSPAKRRRPTSCAVLPYSTPRPSSSSRRPPRRCARPAARKTRSIFCPRCGYRLRAGVAAGAARRAAFPESAMKMLFQLLPALLAAGVGGYALFRGTDVFSALTDGALQGLRTVGRIAPVLVCLLPAVGALRASGAIDAFTALLRPRSPFSAFRRRTCRSCCCAR